MKVGRDDKFIQNLSREKNEKRPLPRGLIEVKMGLEVSMIYHVYAELF
jgi:hypothetical protein